MTPINVVVVKSEWAIPLHTAQLAAQCVCRYYDIWGIQPTASALEEAVMDVVMCHTHGCPLDFRKMLAGPKWSMVQDIRTIRMHLNRITGRLPDGIPLHYRRVRRRRTNPCQP